MIEDAQLGFYAGLSIADTPKLPAWNPGDEFEAARKKALGDVGKGGRRILLGTCERHATEARSFPLATSLTPGGDTS